MLRRKHSEPKKGFFKTYEDHTANDTLLAADFPMRHTNSGASGTITLTLPAAVANAEYYADFHVLEAQALRIDPNGSEQIHVNGSLQAAGKYISCSEIGGFIRLYCRESGVWRTRDKRHAWAVES